MPKGRKKRRDRGATAGGESAKFKKITYHVSRVVRDNEVLA